MPAASLKPAAGSVVRLQLGAPARHLPARDQQVPLAALDERADGPRLWRVVDGAPSRCRSR